MMSEANTPANLALEPTAKSWPRLNAHRYAGLTKMFSAE
jgi:hypothetical protein